MALTPPFESGWFSLGVDVIKVIQMDMEAIHTSGFRHPQSGFRQQEQPARFPVNSNSFPSAWVVKER